MNLRSLILHHFIMECGKSYIQQIVSDKTVPEEVKPRNVSEIIEFLRACDSAYNLAEEARKIRKFLDTNLYRREEINGSRYW